VDIGTRLAREQDIPELRALLKVSRTAFGFIPTIVLQEAIRQGEVVVATNVGAQCAVPVGVHGRAPLLGMIRYHHRRDRVTTLHEIAVHPGHQGRGIGRALLERLEEEARGRGQTAIRLKCPIDLPANGFYAHLGFTRVGIEAGKRRPLVVWEKQLHALSPLSPDGAPLFFLSLTHGASETRRLIQLWDESGDRRNPFARVVFTPLFSEPGTVTFIRRLKEERGSVVMFDSGGYQVQMGRMRYEELFDRLLRFYRENDWADWFVLPDHVPLSNDSHEEVEFKVRESLDFARLFLGKMPAGFVERAVAVVHGRTEEQVARCVEAYVDMGVRYLGFGSFGTSGPNGTVNMVSQKSLSLLRLVQVLAGEHGCRLHIFGIGSPSHLIRFSRAGVVPTSFDSAGWWKAGGFGNIFFPQGRQLHITAVSTVSATLANVSRQKQRSGHRCFFCDDLELMRSSRMRRILHNLAVMLDTLERGLQ
jgi:GNAT superfamily N-acetyltransferase